MFRDDHPAWWDTSPLTDAGISSTLVHMAARSDAALRRLTLVAFAMYTVLTIVWSSGLAGRRGLAHPGSAIIDIGSEINFAALVLGGLLLTWLRPRNCIGWLLTLSGLLGACGAQ